MLASTLFQDMAKIFILTRKCVLLGYGLGVNFMFIEVTVIFESVCTCEISFWGVFETLRRHKNCRILRLHNRLRTEPIAATSRRPPYNVKLTSLRNPRAASITAVMILTSTRPMQPSTKRKPHGCQPWRVENEICLGAPFHGKEAHGGVRG